MLVAFWVDLAQVGQQAFPFFRDLVAIIGAVFASHEQPKRQVAEVVRLGVVWVAGHHGGGGPAVGHARRKLVHAVAPGRVAHEVYAVRIDAARDDIILNHPVKQPVDVRLMPEVPRVGWRARRDVNALLGLVKFDLVFPLAVIDAGGRATAAVH